ncbi:Hypothetical predicted protein [Mytilus galloprovincialis]|uniref:SOCS box domain-containing protein n=1 Tax=Mytilus galloprovincialis TaxID=29158 RepID=A0A8B6G4F9_MYTGA|nr:Hypothetical predicted protein [Mytilus galloprovincialis]
MVDKSGRSALFLAIQTCSDDPIDDRNEMEIYSPSKKIYYNASREIVLELLKNGSDINLQDNSGNTALTTFCHSGSDAFIGEALIQAGADPKSCDNIYCLHFAVTNRQLRSSTEPWVNFLCLLLDKGASPNEFKGNVSNLIEVTVKKNILLIEKILKHGGDVNFADNTNRTALHYACIIEDAMDRDEIINKLLDFGAGLNCPSITGEKPLDVLMKSMIHDLRNNCDIWDNPNDPYCQKVVVDLSSFNRFVSGGCDLTPVQDLKKDMFTSFQKYIFEWSTNLIVESNDRSNESVLLTLLQTGLFETAECLIRCGWQVEREKWFSTNKIANLHTSGIEICGTSRILEVQDGKDQFQKFIDKKDKGPRSLSIICRKTIRQQLIEASRGAEIETRINLLPIPSIIQSFLAFRYLLQDYEIIKLRKNHRFEMPYYSENDNEYSDIRDEMFDYYVY